MKSNMIKNKFKATTIAMLAPFTFFFTLFMLVPMLSAIYLSFTSFNIVQTPVFVGFNNYIRLFFEDDVFLIALKNTLLFAFLTGPVGYVLSFIFAWLINEFNVKLRSVLTLIFYTPVLAGNIYFIWLYLFSGDAYGFFNSTLMRLGVINDPIYFLTDPRYNFWVVVIVVLWRSMGMGFLAFVAGLQTMNKDLAEAGSIDGIRNRFQELWYVTLPQMGPMLIFGAVMAISASFAVGAEAMQLTGFPSPDYSTHTLVLHIIDYGFIRYEMGYASAIAVVLFFMIVVFWKYISDFLRRFSND